MVMPMCASRATNLCAIRLALYFPLACQPGVARAFALRAAELRRFAPLAGSAQLSRFAITQASDELSERLLFHCSGGVARAFAQKAS